MKWSVVVHLVHCYRIYFPLVITTSDSVQHPGTAVLVYTFGSGNRESLYMKGASSCVCQLFKCSMYLWEPVQVG